MSVKSTGSKAVAIASSTGGPKALQSLIPFLPAELDAPVFIVQHMPAGFTEALSIRLDQLSGLSVKEAAEGDTAEKGHAYLARGGRHMEIRKKAGKHPNCFNNDIQRKKAGKETLHYMDEPPREGVRPCANYMYESLMDSNYDEIICVVLTGMGADGTEGIRHLKEKKKVTVIAQDEETCTVYGMPKSVVQAQLADKILPLTQIAGEITKNVGVI